MKFRLGFALLLSILIATISVEAQFGGLIKKKIGEAVGGNTPKPAPESDQGTSGSALGCDVSGDAMDRLLKGMEAEHAAREAALKDFAGTKSPEQYQACQTELLLSPEGQKISEALLSLPENATPVDFQNVMTKVGADMQALTQQKCGPSSNDTRDQVTRKFDDARDIGPQTAKMTECYARIEEHALSFCQLPESEQTKAQNGGLKVPGTGKDVYWVFTVDEAKAYKPRCERLVSLMAALARQDQQKQAALDKR